MRVLKDLKTEFPSIVDRAYREYKRHRKVEEIMSKDVLTIGLDTKMDEAAKIMGNKHVGSLIVTNYETPVGIVTERDLLSDILVHDKNPAEIAAKDVMSYPLTTIGPEVQIKKAAQIMIKQKSRLAVFDFGHLKGIITASDLIRSLPDAPETRLKVDEYMSKHVITADEKTPIKTIMKIMGEKRIGSVIITKKDRPHMSIFTERDLLTTFLAKGKSLNVSVGTASSSPLITASLGISVHKTASIMAANKIKRLPITENGELAGIVTARDLVEAYAQ
ncbi:MAG: CBS domain-containing protein [Candidatus Bathyarchaeum tardum]|nr:MAG: CBS domain-containing protein [Candidatus Bathyarchaeum tardum]